MQVLALSQSCGIDRSILFILRLLLAFLPDLRPRARKIWSKAGFAALEPGPSAELTRPPRPNFLLTAADRGARKDLEQR